MRKQRCQRFKTDWQIYNLFAIIANQWDLKSDRSDKDLKGDILIAIPDWFKIDRT